MGKRRTPATSQRTPSKKLRGGNKELLLIPGAVHTDLYDNLDVIPFDRITEFFRKNLG